MNREVERKDSISNSVTIPRDFFSPTQNRPLNRESEYKSIMNESSLNSNGNYSPFVVKKSSNLLNSNSSASSRKIFTEGPNYKNYTPSPNLLKERLSDRFIPVNKGLNLLEKFELTKKWSSKELDFECNIENDNTRNNETSSKSSYTNLLENNFFNSDSMNYIGKQKPKYSLQDSSAVKSKLFSFREEPKRKSCGIPTGPSTILENSEGSRKINTKPYKVIEAPGLIDDFYLNLVDWSSKNDIAAGLSNSVYLWCANKTQCVKLLDYEGDKYVSSVIWSPSGNEVAIGNSEGSVEIWDITTKKILRSLDGHTARIGVVAWNNWNILSTGSKDYSILNRDLRCPEESISSLVGHKQEVCGLKWSFDGTQLASGGNDNKLMVWSLHSDNPIMKSSSHTAAVKAIAWSPHQNNLLTSGGGTADRCIRFWNTSTLSQVNYIDTGSQVCNLVFSKNSNELVSTHGYSLNQIILWKLPTMTKIATFTGHNYRVLYLGMSPNGQNIVTGAGDQTLRFWNIFPSLKNTESSALFPSNTDLR